MLKLCENQPKLIRFESKVGMPKTKVRSNDENIGTSILRIYKIYQRHID